MVSGKIGAFVAGSEAGGAKDAAAAGREEAGCGEPSPGSPERT